MTQPIRHGSLALPSSNLRAAAWRKRILQLDESHPEVARLALTCEGFLRRAIHNDRSGGYQLVIHGKTGTGKTHAATKIVTCFNHLSTDAWLGPWGNHGPTVGRTPFARLLDFPQVCDMPDLQFLDLMDDLQQTDLLVLDDVGAESDRFKSGQPAVRLRQVLNLAEHRWLLVTTNIPKNSWTQFFDVRVNSRLSKPRYLSLGTAPDFRLNKS